MYIKYEREFVVKLFVPIKILNSEIHNIVFSRKHD